MRVKNTLAVIYVLILGKQATACVEELLERIDASEYGYTDFNGPRTWYARWPQCGGSLQSPVTLNTCTPSTMPELVFEGHGDFRPAGFRLHNTYQSVEVQFSGAAPFMWGGPFSDSNYTLAQVHFHWGSHQELGGSEHSLRGHAFVLEAHLVHFKTEYGDVRKAAAQEDGLAVVAVLFHQSTEENPSELALLTSKLHQVRQGGSYTLLEGGAMTWLKDLASKGAPFLSYRGSLTTPPCSPTVIWVILAASLPVGSLQMREFRALKGHVGTMKSNRRPLQPLRGRLVTCSRP